MHFADLSPAVRRAYLEVIGSAAQDADLGSTTTQSVSVRTEDLGHMIAEITTQHAHAVTTI